MTNMSGDIPKDQSAGKTGMRRKARELALQCLHQFDVQDGKNINQ